MQSYTSYFKKDLEQNYGKVQKNLRHTLEKFLNMKKKTIKRKNNPTSRAKFFNLINKQEQDQSI